MASKRFFIIGLSGVTNSGKSTIGSRLSKALPNCTWMCQDHYFLAADDPRVDIEPNGMQNWDTLSALDMDTMLSDVFVWIEKHKDIALHSQAFLIIEGFTIFNHRPLSNLCDKKFFLQVDKNTAYDRRRTRVYDPPDVPGYFSEIVWPMYLKNLKDIEDQIDIEYVDGLFELDTLYQQILDSIRAEFVEQEAS